jgi:hypothetical protein
MPAGPPPLFRRAAPMCEDLSRILAMILPLVGNPEN